MVQISVCPYTISSVSSSSVVATPSTTEVQYNGGRLLGAPVHKPFLFSLHRKIIIMLIQNFRIRGQLSWAYRKAILFPFQTNSHWIGAFSILNLTNSS